MLKEKLIPWYHAIWGCILRLPREPRWGHAYEASSVASPLSTAPGEGISMKLVALWEFGDLRLQKIGWVVLRSPRSDSKATTPSTNEPMDDEIARTWERAVSLKIWYSWGWNNVWICALLQGSWTSIAITAAGADRNWKAAGTNHLQNQTHPTNRRVIALSTCALCKETKDYHCWPLRCILHILSL